MLLDGGWLQLEQQINRLRCTRKAERVGGAGKIKRCCTQEYFSQS